VKTQAAVRNNRLPELLDQLRLQVTDAFPFHADPVNETGSPREVRDRPRKRLIHGEIGVREPRDSLFVSESLLQGRSETDPDVLNGMMCVDLEIAFAVNIQVEKTVAREELQHVIEKWDPCVDVAPSAAVQVQRDFTSVSRVFRVTVAFRSAIDHSSLAFRGRGGHAVQDFAQRRDESIVFRWCSTVTRRQFDSMG